MGFEVKDFAVPPKDFRPVPFWSWNDELTEEELIRQIALMDEQGWGGFFMHSRIGIRTPYLTDEWMHLVKVCVEEAKNRGMGAWLYDEDRWPSGFAGGAVPALGKRYRMKNLVLAIDEITDPEDLVEIYQVYSCTMKNGKPRAIQKIHLEETAEAKEEGRTVLYIYQRTCPIGHRWFNGYCYPDLLDPVVTDAFLESTYELYKDYLEADFGKTIPGVFTDEPACHYRSHAPLLSYQWTPSFPQWFKEKYGYEIKEHFLSLFFDLGEYEKVRYDFWKLLAECFVENFSKRVYQWCEDHQLKLTGHYMCEDNFVSQMQWICSAMPHYEYMHIPGIDHLARNINDDITAKQCSSVANQLGRQRVLSEMFGVSGQNMSFEDMKWIADWHFVHGINLVNPHLSLYSTRGCRKRDYPPNIFIQQPYWSDIKGLSDYLSRTAYVLSCGSRVTDVLVLHPIETGWVTFTPDKQRVTKEYNRKFTAIIEELLRNQIDYDLGDESLIEKYGEVSNGEFHVGEQSYGVVVVPPMITLRSSTLKLLTRFVQAGGDVLFVGEVPTMIDGRKSELLVDQEYTAMDELIPVLCRHLDLRVQIEAPEELRRAVWYHQRRLENGDEVYFLANTSKESSGHATVKIPLCNAAGRHLFRLNSESGELYQLDHQVQSDQIRVSWHFAQAGSLLILLTDKPERYGFVSQTAMPDFSPGKVKRLPVDWKFERLDPNALCLDMCQYKVAEGAWSEPMFVLFALEELYKLGKRQQEFRFAIRQVFHVKHLPSHVALAMEMPVDYKVYLNGRRILSNDDGYWLDPTLRKKDITPLVTTGENVLEYYGTYRDLEGLNELYFGGHSGFIDKPINPAQPSKLRSTEIDATFVIGDFALEEKDGRFVIVQEPRTLNTMDFTSQGYPFYAGKMVLSTIVELSECPNAARLVFDQLCATVAEVLVNGQNVGKILWRPYMVDLDQVLRQGHNRIEVVLTNNLRNLFGPHHHTGVELKVVGPGTFVDKEYWTDEYKLTPVGLGQVCLELE
ncbi:MAG: hypothetical protein M0Q40_00240 [Limnochordia bacterium]|jgi:hypothetical protein|nr:hypothetical protein [Limnochordia bacterium]